MAHNLYLPSLLLLVLSFSSISCLPSSSPTRTAQRRLYFFIISLFSPSYPFPLEHSLPKNYRTCSLVFCLPECATPAFRKCHSGKLLIEIQQSHPPLTHSFCRKAVAICNHLYLRRSNSTGCLSQPFPSIT